MSIQLIESEIRRSLATTEPEVICIKGHWGVGKTFAWNRYLEQARVPKDGIALRHYSYVTLFGITSLEDFKFAIFENTVGTRGIGIEPSIQTVQSHTMEVMKHLGKKALTFLQQLPILERYAGSVAPVLWFMAVRETIVCVDDIERRGEKLSMRDVLGLLSNLKEQKRCKVILILNDDAEDREKDQLTTYFEKVVDKSLRFAPTAAECVQIAQFSETAVSKLLRECCVTLGISNIRVLKRIEYFVHKVEPLLKEFDEEVLKQAVKSIALLCWCVHEPKNAPPIELLEKRLAIRFNPQAKKTLTESEVAWSSLLDVYGFSALDNFDRLLIDGIRNGYFDPELVKRIAASLDERIKFGKSDCILKDAWSLYHDSFDDNEEAVAITIFDAHFNSVETFSPGDLNGAVVLLKDLGRPEQAQKLIEQYITSRKEKREFFDLDQNLSGRDITDEDVRKAFLTKFQTLKDDREPTLILLSIAENQGWHPDDIKVLAAIPVNAYYTMFKTHRSVTLRKLIDACLQFDRIGDLDEHTRGVTREVSRRAKEALLRIGKESRLNALRVRKYGVVVPSSDAANQS